MVQVPRVTRVTVFPETVHTRCVRVPKVTGSPEEALALTVNGALPIKRVGRALKVRVWAGRVMVVRFEALAPREPPPVRLTELVTDDGALPDTFTVTVIA